MSRISEHLAGAALAVTCSVIPSAHAMSPDLSPLALVADKGGRWLYVAEADARQVAVFDGATRNVQQTMVTSGEPTGLTISNDGRKLYVTCAGPEGPIDVFDTEPARKSATLHAGHTPMAPCLSPDGKWLYVCNRFSNRVSIINTASGKLEVDIAVVREPIAAALTPGGERLLVANHLPACPADGDYVAAGVSIIDTGSRTVAAFLQLPNGSTGLRGICISPDGKLAYITHLLARYQVPTTQLDRGWMNTNALSIIDVNGCRLVNTVILDDIDLGAANPWGVVCTSDGRYVCVAHAGTHELSVIDRAALHRKLGKVATGERVSEASTTAADVPNDLSFLSDIRRRVQTGGGPRGLLAVGSRIYAAEYFGDSLGMIDLTADTLLPAVSWPLGPKPSPGVARLGEMLFNDATLCFQHWQSCASCHPDGRTDGLNWDLLNDGIGNPKNTKSMLKVYETPPAMSLGIRKDAGTAVHAGFQHILFTSPSEARAEAIGAYLRSLSPIPSPHLQSGCLSAAARRGGEIFKSAGCAKCHAGQLYTDGLPYNIGTGRATERDRTFDTPALTEVWRTAPYLHDGRAATLEEVLTTCNPGDEHGRTSGLGPDELSALAEFVLSQ